MSTGLFIMHSVLPVKEKATTATTTSGAPKCGLKMSNFQILEYTLEYKVNESSFRSAPSVAHVVEE